MIVIALNFRKIFLNKWFFSLNLILAMVVNIGCGSLKKNAEKQPILIQSQPQNLDIFIHGSYQGKTPKYVGVSRQFKGPVIEIKKGNKLLAKKRLSSRYRWGDSFFSGLIFFGWAPISWIWDLYFGSAWEYSQPPVFSLQSQSKTFPEKSKSRDYSGLKGLNLEKLVIAPPKWVIENEDEELPQKIGRYWEQQLKLRYPDSEVMSFGRSLTVFLDHSYDFDRGRRLWAKKPTRAKNGLQNQNKLGVNKMVQYDEHRGSILLATGASHIFESSLRIKNKKLELKGVLENVYTGQVFKTESKTLSSSHFEPKPDESSKSWTEWINFLPNAISIDSATYRPKIILDGEDVYGQRVRKTGFWNETLNYLGAFGVSRFKGPISRHRWKFDFHFAPLATLSFGQIKYSEIIELQDLKISRWNLGAGIGPELGWGSRFGRFYAKFIPSLTWTKLDWESASTSKSYSGVKLEGLFELGYSFFVTSHFVLRIFSRYVNENQDVWEVLFDERSPSLKDRVKDVGYDYYGLSFGWYWGKT